MAGARDPPTAGHGGGAWTTAASSSARLGTPGATRGHHQPPTPAAQQQQTPQRAAAVVTPPPGLLLIDMPHLREALARYFPQLVAGSPGAGVGGGGALPLEPDAEAQLDILLPSIVSCLEAAYGTHFTKR